MPKPIDGDLRDYLEALRDLLEVARPDWAVDNATVSLDKVLQVEHGQDLDLGHETDYLRDRLAEVERARQQESTPPPAPAERPAYDQAEEDELGWCAECGQACGHRGHRHGQGDQGTTVCEQCGVTLDPIT